MSTIIYNWHEKDDAQQMSGQLVIKSEAKASGVLTKDDVVYFRFRSRVPNADFDFDYTPPPGYRKFGLTPASHPFPGAPDQDSLQRNAGIWMDQVLPQSSQHLRPRRASICEFPALGLRQRTRSVEGVSNPAKQLTGLFKWSGLLDRGLADTPRRDHHEPTKRVG